MSFHRLTILHPWRGHEFGFVLALGIAVGIAAARERNIFEAQFLPHEDRDVLVNRAGVRLLFLHTKAGQKVNNPAGFDL